MLLFIFNAIFPVFVMVLAGYILQKTKNNLNADWAFDFVLFVASPALAFTVFVQASFSWLLFVKIFLVSFLIIIALLLSFKIIAHFFKEVDNKALEMPIVFMNTGNLGLPLSYFLFGLAGLSIAIIFHTVLVILIYSLGVFLLSNKGNAFDFLKLPHIYACFLAIIVNFLNIELPVFILRSLELLGQVTIPLMLLFLGIALAKISFKNQISKAILASFLRIFLGVGIAFLVLKLFQIEGTAFKVIILVSVMPSATVNQILVKKYGYDASLCASVIAITTISSLIYLPILIYFIQ